MAVHRLARTSARIAIVLVATLLAGWLVACETAPDLHGSGSERWQLFGIGLHF